MITVFSKMENLGFAVNLTHLYLQKNKITKIEGLVNLKRLSKLPNRKMIIDNG